MGDKALKTMLERHNINFTFMAHYNSWKAFANTINHHATLAGFLPHMALGPTPPFPPSLPMAHPHNKNISSAKAGVDASINNI